MYTPLSVNGSRNRTYIDFQSQWFTVSHFMQYKIYWLGERERLRLRERDDTRAGAFDEAGAGAGEGEREAERGERDLERDREGDLACGLDF
jgi:hypothetical protein